MDNPEVRLFPCKICGKKVAVTLPEEDNPFFENVLSIAKNAAAHSECIAQLKASKRATEILKHESKRSADWEMICPVEFRKEINHTNKAFRSSRYTQVLSWRPQEKGLYICGHSGQCKTRYMFAMLAREFKEGRKIMAYMHSDLRIRLTSLASADQMSFQKFVDSILQVEILFIDDFAKGRSTPAADEATFSIIDGRSRMLRPTLYTSNLSIADAVKAFPGDFQVPLMRRLTETTTELSW